MPLNDVARETVIGTLDIESEKPDASNSAVQEFLDNSARSIRGLWHPR
jgi:putative methionine-R-sulfoxide reductase with GAF domain